MAKHPYAWIFFIIFMLVTSFTVLNLFIGIIVDAMQREQLAEEEADRVREEAREEANFETIMAELHVLRDEIRALKGEGSAAAPPRNPQSGPDL
jgi:voltage-gated sodium channel